MRPLRAVLLVLGVLAALAAPPGASAAGSSRSVLGDDGELYTVLQGPYGELFADGTAATPDSPVLAIDTLRPDGTHTRSLVPGTGDPEVDGSPTMVFEASRGTLYLVWESKLNPTTSRLLLAGMSDGEWTETIEISGDVSPLKGEPRVVVTRDHYVKALAEGEPVDESRTVIHVLWWEESGSGSGVFYTPVVLANGRYVGWNPVLSLEDALRSTAGDAAKSAEVPTPLLRAPALEKGRDSSAVVAGLVDPSSGEMLLFEIRLLPGEIGVLADRFERRLAEHGRADPDEISNLADVFRGQVIEIGTRFNPDLIGLYARQSARELVDEYERDPNRPPEELAGGFRGQVIEIGATLIGDLHGARGIRSKIVEVAPSPADGTETPPEDRPTHLIQLKLLAVLPPPPIDGTGVQTFLSESGEHALVSWKQDDTTFYSESTETEAGELGWTSPRALLGTAEISAREIAEILHDRIRRRP